MPVGYLEEGEKKKRKRELVVRDRSARLPIEYRVVVEESGKDKERRGDRMKAQTASSV